jgi:hypothetical protein
MTTSIALAAADLAAHGVAFAPQIAGAARRHGLDPRLLAAVAAQETGGPGANAGRNIVGDGGHGRGLFQIDDRYHGFARTADAMDPSANAEYAATMLHGLLQRYGGNVHRALSAYNAGSGDATGTLTTWRDGARLGYADSVMRHYAALGGSPSELVDDLACESPRDQESVNALGAFAQSALPMPSYTAPPLQTTSYRQLAGMDRNGTEQPDDLADLVCSD